MKIFIGAITVSIILFSPFATMANGFDSCIEWKNISFDGKMLLINVVNETINNMCAAQYDINEIKDFNAWQAKIEECKFLYGFRNKNIIVDVVPAVDGYCKKFGDELPILSAIHVAKNVKLGKTSEVDAITILMHRLGGKFIEEESKKLAK